jgi:hypothetical protein
MCAADAIAMGEIDNERVVEPLIALLHNTFAKN